MRCVLASLIALALVLSVAPGLQKVSRWFLASVVSLKAVLMFPDSSNHFAVEFLVAWMAALVCLDNDTQRGLLLSSLRWLLVIVFFQTGLQKLLYGTYFRGTFLATRAADQRFSWFVSLLIPRVEFQSLLALAESGSRGPYALNSIPGRIVSNGIYLGEMAAPILTTLARTRALGVALLLALTVAIEVVAREALFGLLVLQLTALFFPTSWARRTLVATVVVEALLVGAQLYLGGTVRFFN